MKVVKRFYSPEEDAILRELYAETDTRELSRMLGRPVSSIYRHAKRIGLRKSHEYMSRTCNPGGRNGMQTRFKPGNVPYNKGKRLCDVMSPESIQRTCATRFKPGQAAHNAYPIGYESVNKDGYVMVKVENGKRMIMKHRWVWVQNFGSIPSGYIIRFRDGDRKNCTPSNLYLMSRADNARQMVLSLSPETRRIRNEKRNATMREIIRKDKMRIRWGLEPVSGLVKKYYPYEKRI